MCQASLVSGVRGWEYDVLWTRITNVIAAMVEQTWARWELTRRGLLLKRRRRKKCKLKNLLPFLSFSRRMYSSTFHNEPITTQQLTYRTVVMTAARIPSPLVSPLAIPNLPPSCTSSDHDYLQWLPPTVPSRATPRTTAPNTRLVLVVGLLSLTTATITRPRPLLSLPHPMIARTSWTLQWPT